MLLFKLFDDIDSLRMKYQRIVDQINFIEAIRRGGMGRYVKTREEELRELEKIQERIARHVGPVVDLRGRVLYKTPTGIYLELPGFSEEEKRQLPKVPIKDVEFVQSISKYVARAREEALEEILSSLLFAKREVVREAAGRGR